MVVKHALYIVRSYDLTRCSTSTVLERYKNRWRGRSGERAEEDLGIVEAALYLVLCLMIDEADRILEANF
ncbi:hypothetical protein A2U01_0012067, partial [Trifolium medium]|nr:hypothetical protein [Trifolium medium]